MQLHELELWNCFSYWPSVHKFDWLDGLDGKFLGLDKKFYHGQYLFTIDWAHPDTNILDWSILKYLKNISVHIYWLLITGILQLSLIIAFCGMLIATLLITDWPDYKVQTTYWDAENTKLVTEDTDKMFYQMEEKNELKS